MEVKLLYMCVCVGVYVLISLFTDVRSFIMEYIRLNKIKTDVYKRQIIMSFNRISQ